MKITIPRATPGVIRQTYLTGNERDLIIEIAPRPEKRVMEAAEVWLTHFIDMYGWMDTGPGDPVHAVREKAREFLDAGATEDEPFTISEQMTAALHGDSHAAALGDGWRKELERLK